MNKVRKKKRIVLLLFVTLLLGGLVIWTWRGQNKDNAGATGLNPDLPAAKPKENEPVDKLGFYEQAMKDSLRREEWLRNDPYFNRDTTQRPTYPNELEEIRANKTDMFKQNLNTSPYEKVNNPEEKILARIKELERAIENPGENLSDARSLSKNELSAEIDRLEQLLQISNSPASEDPSMKQLEGTLDKILDIQHPQRIREREVEKQALKNQPSAELKKEPAPDTLVKGFFGMSSEEEYKEEETIEAAVHRDQVVVNGSIVQFRLLTDVFVNGKMIPIGTLVSGKVQLEGERLQVTIQSIRFQKNVYAVKLTVYDMDGLPGIHIPGAINRDVAKETANNSLSLLDFSGVEPTLKGRAIQEGLGAAKNLFSRKSKLVKVMLKANYQVLFK